LAFGAVPISAGIIRNPQCPAVIALIDMTAQLCRTANLDRTHGTKMANGHLMTMALSVGWPKSPEDITHL